MSVRREVKVRPALEPLGDRLLTASLIVGMNAAARPHAKPAAPPADYMTIDLSNVLISSYDATSSS